MPLSRSDLEETVAQARRTGKLPMWLVELVGLGEFVVVRKEDWDGGGAAG